MNKVIFFHLLPYYPIPLVTFDRISYSADSITTPFSSTSGLGAKSKPKW